MVLVTPELAWRADPKSISTGEPSSRMKTLSGLMSRCRKPAACTFWMPSRRGAMRVSIVSSSGCGFLWSQPRSEVPRS
jgi:hypothetical protein